MDTDFENYCSYGMNLISNLSHYFEIAPLEGKKKILGSIFPENLMFEGSKCRTKVLNPALALILQKNSGLQKEKAENSLISEEISAYVPRRGLEPPHLTAPEPKSGVSTNFTIWANRRTNRTVIITICQDKAFDFTSILVYSPFSNHSLLH